MVVGSPARVTVSWGCGRLLVGLTAQRSTIGWPEEIPPSMPPWRLPRVATRPARISNGSLFSLPRARATPKPAPYSTPSTAGRLNSALPRSRLELVEHRFAPARRHAGGHEFRDAADRVALRAHPLDQFRHPRRGLLVRATHRGRLDLVERDRGRILDPSLDVADPPHVADDPDPPTLPQQLLRHRRRRHPHRCLAGTGASAAPVVAKAVLRVERVVGVARAVLGLDLAVVLRTLVPVLDQKGDRRAGRLALEHAGQDAALVRFVPLRRQSRLTRPAAVEVRLQIGLRQLETGRNAVEDAGGSPARGSRRPW